MDKMCDLCKVFLNPVDNIKTKVHYKHPRNHFIILDCNACKVPMLVWGKHERSVFEEVRQELEGFCRHEFGKSCTFRREMRKIKDHYHFHIFPEGG